MKLKSSNRYTVSFLAILVVGVVCLLMVSANRNKKESKYPEVPAFEKKTSLDAIQLTLSEKAFNKLEKKRNRAIAKGILETSDSDYVPAVVTFRGVDYKAEIRLKGDWTDHLKDDKWSFRVKLKGDETILGMRKFSIHNPKTRGVLYTAEWLYQKAIKAEKLMGLRYGYLEGVIHVKVKGTSDYVTKEVGYYAIEETFDKRTIESNGGKESVILKFSENNWWNEVDKSLEVGADLGYKWGDFMNFGLVEKAKFEIFPFSEEKTVQDSTMFKYFKLSRGLLEDVYLGKRPIHESFNVKKLAMQNAILNLFGGVHGIHIINLRFYYNPITSKLEPIAFDGNSGGKLSKYEHFLFLNQEKDSVYLKELAYALDVVHRPNYLNKLFSDYYKEMEAFSVPLKDEFKGPGIKKVNLEFNQKLIKDELIRLKNLYNLTDINVEEELIEEVKLPAQKLWVSKGVKMEKHSSNNNKGSVYKVSRSSLKTPAYIVLKDIKVSFEEEYKTTIKLKKGDLGSHFGLRVQGTYPNRIDAVFDLQKGKLKGVKSGGNFDLAKASIKEVGGGWYECTLSGKIKESSVKIILGPTASSLNVSGWEGATNEACNAFFIPSSLKIEEKLK
ncbi:MAG: hypothetical protein BM564_00750 [Bacteroidetes bacterium MedPE-SWsnd-G2]|nr:MAG: hypothetical protein BM564_00750 [Bacteroidetes bacterium MedPE-SWsnd-G2]